MHQSWCTCKYSTCAKCQISISIKCQISISIKCQISISIKCQIRAAKLERRCALYMQGMITPGYTSGIKIISLKGSVRENERMYRLTAINNRFWSLLIFLLSVASIMRKLLKTSETEERRFPYKLRKLQHTTRIVTKSI